MAGLAEKMFWRSPQLVDNLINFLDVESVAELAKANQFTAELLESSKKTWGELVQRSLCGGACAEELVRRTCAEELPLLSAQRTSGGGR